MMKLPDGFLLGGIALAGLTQAIIPAGVLAALAPEPLGREIGPALTQPTASNRRENTLALNDTRERKWQAAMISRVQRRIKEREQLPEKRVEQFIDWHEPLLLKTLSEMRNLHLEDQQISDVCLMLVHRLRLADENLGASSLTATEKKARRGDLEKSWQEWFSRAVAADLKENRDFVAGLLYGFAPRWPADRGYVFPNATLESGYPVGPGDLQGVSPSR